MTDSGNIEKLAATCGGTSPRSVERMVRPEPCPFCGSEAMVMTWETNDDPRLPGWHCGCLEPDCDMNPFTKTRWKTEREAVESWNRRSNAPRERRREDEHGKT